MRQRLSVLADATNEYCGLPVTIEGERLIIEPSHPASKTYFNIGKKDDIPDGCKIVNQFFSVKRGGDVIIWREGNGDLRWGIIPGVNSMYQSLKTMGCSIAWSVGAEATAMEKLRTLIPAHLFHMYFLTGQFLETSKRSAVTYIFRRLRPTVAIRAKEDSDSTRILCALCLHPIGYYEGTWAGSMVPTDDVIAHLLMMRADEPYYWRKANQIQVHRPEAGL